MSQYFPKPYELFGGNINVKFGLSNYATKADLKNVTYVDTSTFSEKVDLPSLKSNADNLDFDKLKNLPTNLSSLKSNVDKSDFDKLVSIPVDLSKLTNGEKNYVVEKYVYNTMIKNIEDEIPDITNLVTKTTLNAKMNEFKGEIPSITNLATTAALTAVENEIPNVSNLV